MSTEVTTDQVKLLLFIEIHHRMNGFPPTLQEMGTKFYAHHATVYVWCEKLIKMGYLVRNGKPHRCYAVDMDRLAAWARSYEQPV